MPAGLEPVLKFDRHGPPLPVPDPVRLVPGRVPRGPRARRRHRAALLVARPRAVARRSRGVPPAGRVLPAPRCAHRRRRHVSTATRSSCPFHGWKYDGTGACTNIPYSQRGNKKAKLRTYPTIVRNGFVLAWYHPHDEAPQWEIPVIEEIGDPGWSDFYSSSYVIHTVPQEMSENGADPAHFQFVHGTDDVAELESYDTDGPCSVMLSKQSFVTPRGVTERSHRRLQLRSRASPRCGSAASSTRSTSRPRPRSTTRRRRCASTSSYGSSTTRSSRRPVANAFVKEINKQVQEDRPIWEHKAFIPTPRARRHRRPDPQVPQVVQPVLRGAVRAARAEDASDLHVRGHAVRRRCAVVTDWSRTDDERQRFSSSLRPAFPARRASRGRA